MTFLTGEKYEELWEVDNWHGKSERTNADGSIVEGEMKKGELVVGSNNEDVVAQTTMGGAECENNEESGAGKESS